MRVDNHDLTRVNRDSLSPHDLFAKMASERGMTLWLVRPCGFLALSLSFQWVCAPPVALADIPPLLGKLLSFGISMAAFNFALALSAIFVTVSWFAYRPLLCFALCFTVGIILFAMFGGKAGGGGGGIVMSGDKAGRGGGGSLVSCLRDCGSMRDDASLFDACSRSCTTEFA